MGTENDEEDDGGFYGYVPQAINLGGGLVAGAAVAIVFAYVILLPLFVTAGSRHEARRKAAILENTVLLTKEHEHDETREEPEGPYTYTTTKKKKRSSKVQNGEQPNDQNDGNDDDGDDDQSILSRSSSKSSSTFSSAVAAILDQPRVSRTKTQRRQRRIKEKQILEEGLQNKRYSSVKNDPKKNDSNQSNDLDPSLLHLLQGVHPGAISPLSNNNHNNPPDPPGIVMEEGEEGVDMFFDTTSRPDFETTLSASDMNKPSQHQAHHAYNYCSTQPEMPADEFSTMGALDKVATIASWDIELKRIVRLGTPYCTQALITGLTDTLNVAVIGKLIGTREVSAYVVVNLLVEMTSEFVGGFHQALTSLCSQAIGNNNKYLAGQYVQIATVLYTVLYIPFMIIWAFFMGDALRWFGFDEITVEIGKQYNYILIVDLLMDGVGESVHSFLDVTGFESFSTLIGSSEEVIAFVSILLAGLFGQPTLITVGLLQFGIGMVFFTANIVIIYWKGWFAPYQKGMTGSFAFSNGRAVSLVCRTAFSLSFGMLLTDGEWEILTIMASFMGPAEVSAWAILDTIWSGTHELIDGIANASEVRCAFLLGNDQPYRARLSAYKSMMVGTFSALFLTSLIYSFGDDLPTWLTNDPALQHILRDLLPLFGLATFVKSVDQMSWTLVGSQGRYRLATFICCLTSWFVTIPLAVLFTICFKVNLDGLLTAFISGYLVMGVAHAYFVLRSDWPKLSRTVMEENEAEALRIRDEVQNNDNTTNSTTSRRQPSPSVSSVSAVPGGLTMFPMEIASSGSS